jgi:hypothetical protein
MVNDPTCSKWETRNPLRDERPNMYYSSSFFTLSSRFISIDALAAHE